ncbi:MAG: acyl-CoA synthetase [Bryobacteraceae bacterium]
MFQIDWLARHALYSPDKIAVIEIASGRRVSYAEFNAEANRVCRYLRDRGVRPGDRVSVLLPSCAELLFVLFGTTKLGGIFVPLNHKLAAPEIAQIVADAQPGVVFYDPEFEHLAQVGWVPIETAMQAWTTMPATDIGRLSGDLEAPQMLLYTSGTTGKPKGVVISHRHVLWNAINTSLRMLMPAGIALVHTPMFYTGGLNVFTLPAFFLGATVAILKTFAADEVLREVERLKITALFAVPTQLLMMADSPAFHTADLSGLRYIISGGAPCPVSLIQRWIDRGITLRQGFGLTEVGPNCFALDARDALRKAGSIGFPNFSVEARIVDEEGRDVPPSDVGELILRTPAMCSGYWNNPGQTAAAIRDGWFHTGDLARCDAEGYFYIVDRKKDMFISGGENVYPAEIENLLRTHPKVADAAVVGMPHPKWGETGCAVIVLRPDEGITGTELLAFCAGKIAKFKIPKLLVFLDELPRTVSGKVRKQELKEWIGEQSPSR